jgi:(p)ppGpp synthase/HD superfamily hydrolase
MGTVFAQTNIQLFNQLQRQGYSKSELVLIHSAYELAKDLFAGYFIASGRTQIAHVVGTASILASLRVPAGVVAAGLIHNAYHTGDFGDGRRDISDARRRQISGVVGMTVEQYVARFSAVRSSLSMWLRPRSASAEFAGIDPLDAIDRQVLLIVLAEQLEHRRNFEHAGRPHAVEAEIAEQLGFPALASELRKTISEAASVEFLAELASKELNRPQLIAPRSYWRRPAVAFRQELGRAKKRFGEVAHRISRLGLAQPIATKQRTTNKATNQT